MKKIRSRAYHYLAIMVIMAGFASVALGMEHFLAKLVPLTVAGITFSLAAIGMAREIWGEARPEADVAVLSVEETSGSLVQYLVIGALGVGLLLAVYLLGLLIASALFILLTMKLLGIKWWVAILFTIVTPAFIYGFIELALKIELYRGLLFTLFS